VLYDIVGIGQTYLLFRARLAPPYTFAAQLPESTEVGLFGYEDIPWGELAFSSVALALRRYIGEREKGAFSYQHGAIIKRPGAGPNEPGSFQLIDCWEVGESRVASNKDDIR
jgi:ADP-ribose/FAD diphosphatase